VDFDQTEEVTFPSQSDSQSSEVEELKRKLDELQQSRPSRVAPHPRPVTESPRTEPRHPAPRTIDVGTVVKMGCGCFFLVLITLSIAGYLIWDNWDRIVKPDSGGEEKIVFNEKAVTATEYFAVNYISGSSDVYKEAARMARAGEFRELTDALKFIKKAREEVKNKSGGKMVPLLESLNGEDWDSNEAAEIFEGFSIGLSL
jgi:polyhydroxyalkanoate synthesis regulator phasin